jgi:hypothetical protein
MTDDIDRALQLLDLMEHGFKILSTAIENLQEADNAQLELMKRMIEITEELAVRIEALEKRI